MLLRQDIEADTVFQDMRLVTEYTEPDAVVVDDVDPMLFSAYQVSSQRRVVSLNEQYILTPLVRMPRLSETPDLLFDLLGRSVPLYFIGDPAGMASVYDHRPIVVSPVASAGPPGSGYDTLYRIAVDSAGATVGTP